MFTIPPIFLISKQINKNHREPISFNQEAEKERFIVNFGKTIFILVLSSVFSSCRDQGGSSGGDYNYSSGFKDGINYTQSYPSYKYDPYRWEDHSWKWDFDHFLPDKELERTLAEMEEDSRKQKCLDETLKSHQIRDDYDAKNLRGCEGESCAAIPVTVSYLLNEDLGRHRWVAVEVFDNAIFAGSPKRTTYLPDFDSSRIGDRRALVVGLPPGEFYLRAVLLKDGITPEQRTALGSPHQIQAFGVSGGAISSPVRFNVLSNEAYKRNKSCPQLQILELNQIVKAPGEEPNTAARFRLKLNFKDPALIVEGKKVNIEIRTSTDLRLKAERSMALSSELFLIPSHLGRTEHLTGQLEPESYFIFVYFDKDENGFFDPEEASGWNRLTENAPPTPIRLQRNHTELVNIQLQ